MTIIKYYKALVCGFMWIIFVCVTKLAFAHYNYVAA